MSQPTWFLATLYVTPVILVCYYLLGRFSPSRAAIGVLPEMKISEIYVYPIKSLRAIKLASAIATPHGFAHDRTFMLLEKTPTGYKNMAVASYPQMTQFLQEISPSPSSTSNALSNSSSSSTDSTLTIHYLAHGNHAKQSSLTIPLNPPTTSLPTLEISLHGNPTTAYRMPDAYNTWFTSCFGFPVELVHLGSNRRSPRFSNLPFSSSSSSPSSSTPQTSQSLTFTDCAPYLFTSSASLASVSSRIASEMDVTKFRPNVLLEGAKDAWSEDFWSRIRIQSDEAQAEVALVHNCVRCKSINVDYETGRPATGVKGEVLKRLQADRRVDQGARWSPVFGRYGFWVGGKDKEEVVWRVGDKVRVTGVNRERTVWSWPNLG